LLSKLVSHNDSVLEAKSNDGVELEVTAFHAERMPRISLEAFLLRINKYADPSPSVYAAALVLAKRLTQAMPSLFLESKTIHRVVLTCMRVASKFMDDENFSNGTWAKIVGLPLAKINELELTALKTLSWDVRVSVIEMAGANTAMEESQRCCCCGFGSKKLPSGHPSTSLTAKSTQSSTITSPTPSRKTSTRSSSCKRRDSSTSSSSDDEANVPCRWCHVDGV